jgi:hypothetical protein
MTMGTFVWFTKHDIKLCEYMYGEKRERGRLRISWDLGENKLL